MVFVLTTGSTSNHWDPALPYV